jgi:hypothetical protein
MTSKCALEASVVTPVLRSVWHHPRVIRRSIDAWRSEGQASALLIERGCREAGLSCPQTAYVLATAFHESRLGLWMVDHRVRPGIGGVDDGNTVAGHSRYHGRGFARLTGRSAYTTMARHLDLPLLTDPDLAANPSIAATILIEGMRLGHFTGRSLDEYIDDDRVDYWAARQVMEPADHPVRVAGYARAFEAELEGVTADEPTSSDIRHLQTQLNTVGWPLAADGFLGRYTSRAVRDFQAGYCHIKLPVTGRPDPVTRLAIETCAANDGFASDHFRFAEFRAADEEELSEANRVIRVERQLVRALETYRHRVGGPVRIESAYRSTQHRRATCAPCESEHTSGRAVHVGSPTLPADAVAELGAFTSIGHRNGIAVHLGVAHQPGKPAPRVYSLQPRVTAEATPGHDVNDSGGPLAAAGHRSRS